MPEELINLAILEQAAITLGSSIAIGTEYDFPFILKLRPRPRGIEMMPMQFSIIKSAVFMDSPPDFSVSTSMSGYKVESKLCLSYNGF